MRSRFLGGYASTGRSPLGHSSPFPPPAWDRSAAPAWVTWATTPGNESLFWCRHCKPGALASDNRVTPFERYRHAPECLVPLARAAEEAVGGG